MPHKPAQSERHSQPSAAVVLFGVDERGKPQAARFSQGETALATKVARQLQLRVLPVAKPELAALAAKVPAGRIHGTGRSVVPNIAANLFTELLAAAAGGASSAEPPQQPPPSGSGSDDTPPNTKKAEQHRLPKDWDELAPGHLVIAQESPDDGWYVAIIVERAGDMCTLRWRDYPRDRRFTRHCRSLALLSPGQTNPSEPSKPAAAEHSNKNGGKHAGTRSKPTPAGLPKTWEEIDVGHLVLAKDDGPWESYWEAVPTENHGATLTLTWRDYGALPKIERRRPTLALLCPTAT